MAGRSYAAFYMGFCCGCTSCRFRDCCIHKKQEKNEAVVNGFYAIMDLTKIGPLILFLVVVGLILGLAFTDENPFIYFQF